MATRSKRLFSVEGSLVIRNTQKTLQAFISVPLIFIICRSNVPVIPHRMCLFLSHSSWPCHCGFLTFPHLWEISFSSQMISGTVSWLLGLDRIFK